MAREKTRYIIFSYYLGFLVNFFKAFKLEQNNISKTKILQEKGPLDYKLTRRDNI
jgi:hypothetical protein